MGFFDSVKDAAKKAADTAKTSVDNAKQAKAERNAAKAEQERILNEQAKAASEAKLSAILNCKQDGKPGIFCINPLPEMIKFTEDFMVKLLLPATSLKVTKLVMTPYTEDKSNSRKVEKNFSNYTAGEKILFILQSGKEILALTDKYLYIRMMCEENADNPFTVRVELENVSEITFENNDAGHNILCNEQVVMTLPISGRDNDFINLKNYFDRLASSDFEITPEQIDSLIHEKIGDEVYRDAQKYMDDDELIQYFVWGYDSLTAKDYLMCTTHQFVNLNRELLGATQDATRFFYEDINSMKVMQNNSDSILVAALNAALSLCDLEINVAGAKTLIQTLTVKEAERVVQLYNNFRRKKREDDKKPIVVQATAAAIDPVEQLAKLSKLKEAGIISEEEFEAKKADLLAKL